MDDNGKRRVPSLSRVLGIDDINPALAEGFKNLGGHLESIEHLLASLDRRGQILAAQGVPGFDELTTANPRVSAHTRYNVQGLYLSAGAAGVSTLKVGGQLIPFPVAVAVALWLPLRFLVERGTEFVWTPGDGAATCLVSRFTE